MTDPTTEQRHPDTADDNERYRPADSVIAAERAVAAAALSGAKYADELAETLAVADFYNPQAALIYQACCELSGSGAPINVITVGQHLTTTGQVGMLGAQGLPLLHRILNEAPILTPAAIGYHADIVAFDAHRRRMHAEAVRAVTLTGSPTFEAADTDLILDRMQRAALAGQRGQEQPLFVRDDVDEILDGVENRDTSAVISTPWLDINDGVSLSTGQLVIIGARPSMGKSLVGLNLAAHVALDLGEGAVFGSLEMSRRELTYRLVASRAKVNLHRLEHNQMTREDWDRVGRVLPEIHKCHLAVDDGTDLTPARLRSRLRHLRSIVRTRLIVVDYLQLMRGTGRYERRDLELADITRNLKLLAKSEDVCVVALCQLGRGPELRSDHRPVIADLRESGAIEQDADTVIMLYRQDMYEEDSPRAGEIDLIVAKQRSGPRFTATASFQGHYARVVDMARS